MISVTYKVPLNKVDSNNTMKYIPVQYNVENKVCYGTRK